MSTKAILERLEKIEKLVDLKTNLQDSQVRYLKEIQKGDCDKYAIGFNLDDRFSTFETKISIDSWTGYYGNSSCSRSLKITDGKLFEKYFIDALNENFHRIIKDAINLMAKDIRFSEDVVDDLINHLKNNFNKAKENIK